jgi:Flp pilus assembly protein TadG
MFSGFVMFRNFTARWGRETEAVATVEAALVFPILLTLLLGTFDMGNGILANQKTIRASQIVADLMSRGI